MKGRSVIFALTFSAVVVFNACTYRANDPNVCYTENILPLLSSNCGGCHNDLTNYEGTMKYVKKGHPLMSELYKQVKGPNPSMPQGPNKLTQQQLFYLKAWISAGAPNSTNCVACDTAQYKFGADIQPILNNWCVNCHSSSNAGGGYDLSNYAGVVNSLTGGKLLGSIKHDPGYIAMPQGGGKISDCYINKIQNWIRVGHPDN
ncbi:MAG: c-type cytochrome [Bacteroidia bacterium]